MSINQISWAAYFVFVGVAISLGWHEEILDFSGPLAGVKLLVWIVYLGFLGYSLYCSSRENLFRTIRKMSELHWGRQIGADLYLGLLLALFVIYLNEGVAAVLLWALPTLVFANLSILLYFAIHFESIVGHFLV